MAAPRVLVVVNPAARGGARGLGAELESHLATLGWEAQVVTPIDRSGTVSEVAAQLGSGPWTTVVAVGGDGTVGAVAEALAAAGGVPASPGRVVPPLAIVPAGTGNSLYRALWADRPWPEVLAEIAAGCGTGSGAGSGDGSGDGLAGGPVRVRHLDLLAATPSPSPVPGHTGAVEGAGGVRSLLGVSAGLVAEAVAASVGTEGPEGRDRYAAAALAALEHHVPFPARVCVDGEVLVEGPVSLVAVGGARHRAGSFELLPRSVLDDGRLDVCVVAAVDTAAFIDVAALVMTGEHLGHPDVTYAQGRSLTLARSDGRPLVCEVDGDLWDGGAGGFGVEVVAGAVPVWAPAHAAAG